MKEFIFFITISLATCFSAFAATPTSECKAKFSEARARADSHFEKRRYLLAAVGYSGAALVACDLTSRAEVNLGYARSLSLLGESDAARTEWKFLADNAAIPRRIRESAQIDLALTFDTVEDGAFPVAKDALSIWHAKEDPATFDAVVKASSLSPSQKLKLSDLRPKDGDRKSPLLAGVLSGVLPGAGQFYNGQYQTAAVSLVLNSVFLLSTIELAKKKMGFTAVISGIAFSTVYFGNITSAVTGAQAINRERKRSESEALKKEITALTTGN